ncbi:hypothetical protein BDK92_5281 [Micromonospora pisi]|uniref:Catalytic LigB subunit of aromatic ring-opening dioxygenase n=1 Tax=Micromonospora pisi TaxID=589240 RepID=A0A495JPG7_9ACTN|nr:hypothetical protein [Micromonospora pisi]RKR90897.1 hypothetical protein BDK92_5281 [Micromonospora pisi]
MSLVAAAICPNPPLIVPEIAGADAAELDEMRTAVDAAIVRLLSVRADAVLVVGGGTRTERFTYPYAGSFSPWGVSSGFVLGQLPTGGQPTGGQPAGRQPAGTPVTPLSLLVGGWLLSRHDLGDRALMLDAVATDAPAADCAGHGVESSGRRPRIAMLVLGDGSACRGEKSPGYDDPRADAYDEGVASALGDADSDALLGLDPSLSADLRVAGRAAWQVLAGAASAAGAGWTGELSYCGAPYGVGYFVANWEREGTR